MKHVAVVVNEDTNLLDVVLKWPSFNPIGPRLEKGLKMPSCQTAALTTIEEAMKSAQIIDDWLTKQEDGQRTSTAKAKPVVDHYGQNPSGFKLKAEEPKPEPPKIPPPPPPKPPALPPERKEFVPEPFDAE